MRHSLPELYDLIDLPDPNGFPLRALYAAIAFEESRGDPDEFVLHDPPPRGAPSSGLYQVHQPDWPGIYAATEQVRTSALSDEDKIIQMAELAKPVLANMLQGAVHAAETLEARGIPVSLLDLALFVDAAWQLGAGGLLAWARKTTTGNPTEIVNHDRTINVEVSLRDLAHKALGVAPGLAVTALALGVLGAVGVALTFID